jgi:hypothetical protein
VTNPESPERSARSPAVRVVTTPLAVVVADRIVRTGSRSRTYPDPSPLTVSRAYRGTSAVPYSSSIACSTVVRIATIAAVVYVVALFSGATARASATVNRKSPTTSIVLLRMPFVALVHVTVSVSRRAVFAIVNANVRAAAPVPFVAVPAAMRVVPSARVTPTVTVPGSTMTPSS